MKKKKGYQITKHGVTVDDHDESFKQGKKAGSYPQNPANAREGHEVKKNTPSQLAKTENNFGKKRKKRQKIAAMIGKARKEG